MCTENTKNTPTFQDLHDVALQARNFERVTHPVMVHYSGKIAWQYYANKPLQLNIYFRSCETMEEPELQLQFYLRDIGKKEKFVVSLRNLTANNTEVKKVFDLEEHIERLAEEFPDEPKMKEVINFILNYIAYKIAGKDYP